MSAVIEEDTPMAVEDRIARLELDMAEVKSDVKMLNGRVSDLRVELQGFKTEVAKEFGSLRTSIERAKVWMLGTGITTVLGVAALVGLKLH